MQIDHSCLGSGEPQDLFVRAYGYDFSLTDRNRLGYGILGIYGQNFSVDQDQVGRLSGCGESQQEADKGYGFGHESVFTVTNLGWLCVLSVPTNDGQSWVSAF
jgi:hypothetical protein